MGKPIRNGVTMCRDEKDANLKTAKYTQACTKVRSSVRYVMRDVSMRSCG